MNELFNFLFEEVFGILPCFLLVYDKEEIEEKRKKFLLPVASVPISISAIGITMVVKVLFHAIYDLVLSINVDNIDKINNVIKSLQAVIEKLNLQFASSTFLFLIIYQYIRKTREGTIRELGERGCEKFEQYFKIYAKDEDDNDYYLTGKWSFIRKYLNFFIMLNIICMMFLHKLIMEISPLWSVRWYGLLPIASLMLLLECYMYLWPLEERGKTFLLRGKAVNSKDTMDMAKLKRTWENESLKLVSTQISHNVKSEIPGNMMDDNWVESPIAQYFMKYMYQIQYRKQFGDQTVNAGMRLIRGQSVFHACQFYRDMDLCIFFPMYLALVRGKKAMVLLEDGNELQSFRKWLINGLNGIQGLFGLWDIEILDGDMTQAQVGILSFQKLYSPDMVQKLEDFFKEVEFAVILEPSDMLAGGEEFIRFLGDKMKRECGKCTWFLCDKNAEGMIDMFSHLLHIEFEYVSATPPGAKEIITVYWDAYVKEEKRKVNRLPVRKFLGMEADIVITAGKENIRPVYWYGGENVPVRDMQWIMGRYYNSYCKEINRCGNQVWVDESFVVNNSSISYDVQKEKFLILEDYMFNVYEMSRQYASRATNKCILHIFSCNYMLRDFMLENFDTLEKDPKYIAQFIPEYINSSRNLGISLIRRLQKESLAEHEVLEWMQGCEEECRNEWEGLKFVSIKMLQNLMDEILDIKDSRFYIKYRTRFMEEEGIVRNERFFSLDDERVIDKFNSYFNQACYVDETREKRHISKLILAGHLEQRYLPGQFVVFNGKYYEIVSYVRKEKETALLVKRAADQMRGRRYYRQKREYSIRRYKKEEVKICKEINYDYHLSRCHADIEVKTTGYISMEEWNHIYAGEVCNLNDSIPIRHYKNKQILEIEMKGDNITTDWISNMAVCLKESLCTLFPQYYHLLSVTVSKDCLDSVKLSQRIKEYVLSETSITQYAEGKGFWMDQEPDRCCFYIIEDSKEDMGLIYSIERNFIKILDIFRDYGDWCKKRGSNFYEYYYPVLWKRNRDR